MRMALLGASGCGKSVTLKCIAGIMMPDRGHIILDGETLFESKKHINLPAAEAAGRVSLPAARSLSEHDGAAEHPVRHPHRQPCRKTRPPGERTTAAFNILADKCLCYN